MIRRALVLATVLGALSVTPAWAGVPLIDYTLQGTLGQNGWYVSDVTVTWSVNWNGSTPISSTGCEFAVLVPGDTTPTGTTRACSATNAAGTSTVTTSAFRIDETKPTVTGASAARVADRNGWYRSSVGISWQGTDASSGIASCSSITYTGPDSANAAPTGTCQDQAGNVSAASAFSLKYDSTAPSVAASGDRAANGAGWYAAPVTFTFSGTDATSGVASCSAPQGYSGPDTSGATLTGTCQDNAGNQASKSVSVKYDATPPQLTAPSPDHAANAAGWFSTPVTFSFAGSDATSGIASCDSKSYSGPDSTGAAVTGGCRDNAGNAATRTTTVKYDATAPQITSMTPDRGANTAGWYVSPVTFTLTGSDATSGIASCDSVRYSGPDMANASATGACRDNAGNSTNRTVSLNYDATAPMVSASGDRAANAAGWYAAPVTFTFSGTDGTSGVASCSAPQTYSGPDTSSTTLTGTCQDKAGNQASKGVPVKYDATPPQLTAPSPDHAANAAGWFSDPVTFTFKGTDPTSGIASCDSKSYNGPDSTGAGVTGGCRDNAGNAATRTVTVKYDATAPQVTSMTADRVADNAGWYVKPVTFTLTGSDATSGIASCDSVPYSGPDKANASATGACRDNAGNSTSRTVSLSYDATPPVVTGATPDRLPDQNGWYVKPVSFVFAGSDATSGLAGCDTVGYSGPDSGSANVTGACHDKAGNTGTLAVPLAYDATPPSFVAADAAAYDSAVTLTWSTVGNPAKILLTRTPGSGTLVFDGAETRFDDSGLQNGVQYSYALTAVDAAGNTAQRSLVATPNVAAGPQPVVTTTTAALTTTVAPTATPSPTPGVATKKSSATKLIGPLFGARVTTPPLLRWKAVAKARYYNVQLWRDGHKILSLHPGRAELQLRRSWTYRGKGYRLKPATYEWFVWPGVGTPTARKFGPLLGASRFTVVARA